MKLQVLAFYCCLVSALFIDQVRQSGHFLGELDLHPLGDGVHMSLLADYSYTDVSDRTLQAKAGFVTDGASIPQALWSFVGSSFTGKYIGAAVIHDVGCVTHKYPWQITHRMFYDAMLDSGVDIEHAKVMYFGVRLGGPRWKSVEVPAADLGRVTREVEARSGQIEIHKEAATSANSSSSPNLKTRLTIIYPQQSISESQLRSFDQRLHVREAQGGHISVMKSMPKPRVPTHFQI